MHAEGPVSVHHGEHVSDPSRPAHDAIDRLVIAVAEVLRERPHLLRILWKAMAPYVVADAADAGTAAPVPRSTVQSTEVSAAARDRESPRDEVPATDEPALRAPSPSIMNLRIGDAVSDVAVRPAEAGQIADPAGPLPERPRGLLRPGETLIDVDRVAAPVTAAGTDARWWMQESVNLPVIAQRTRQKAQRLLAAVDGSRASRDDVDTLPNDERQRVDRFVSRGAGPEPLRCLAHAYAAVASLARLAHDCDHALDPAVDRAEFTAMLRIAAEASSTLFAAERAVTGTDPADPDQRAFFAWISRQTDTHRIRIDRFMRLDDPADWRSAGAMAESVEPETAVLRSRLELRRERKSRRSRIRYQVRRILTGDDGSDATIESWHRLLEELSGWCARGFPVTEPGLLEIMLTVAPLLPDSFVPGNGAQRVLDAVDDRIRIEHERELREEADEDARGTSSSVAEAAARLDGRTITIVGGEARPHAVARLRSAFGTEVTWIGMRDAGRVRDLSTIAGDRRTVVIVLVRWCSHFVTEELPGLCARSGTPCLLAPAGYHPNQVARVILDQVRRSGVPDSAA